MLRNIEYSNLATIKGIFSTEPEQNYLIKKCVYSTQALPLISALNWKREIEDGMQFNSMKIEKWMIEELCICKMQKDSFSSVITVHIQPRSQGGRKRKRKKIFAPLYPSKNYNTCFVPIISMVQIYMFAFLCLGVLPGRSWF